MEAHPPHSTSRQGQNHTHSNSKSKTKSTTNEGTEQRKNHLKNDEVWENNTEDSSDEGGRHRIFPLLNDRDGVFRKVRSILNKISALNYTRLRKRFLALLPVEEENNENERLTKEELTAVLQMVLGLALSSPLYIPIYSALLGYVRRKKPDLLLSNKLKNILYQELKKLTTDKELAQFHNHTQQLDSIRRRKVTLHRFIAELYLEGCASATFHKVVKDLLIGVGDPDENTECLCILLTFAGKKLEQSRPHLVDEIFSKLTNLQIQTPPGLSKRMQFMILDLIEMRQSQWEMCHGKWWCGVGRPTLENRRARTVSENIVDHPTPSRTRTRSECMPTHTQLNPLHSRQLMSLLNKVSASNLNSVARQLQEILSTLTTDELKLACAFILQKMLEDSYYASIHANLVQRVNLGNFAKVFCCGLVNFIEDNAPQPPLFQLLSELYKLNLVTLDQVKTSVDRLKQTTATIAIDSLATLLFIVGNKLEMESNHSYITELLMHFESKTSVGRPHYLLKDLAEFRKREWVGPHPHWVRFLHCGKMPLIQNSSSWK